MTTTTIPMRIPRNARPNPRPLARPTTRPTPRRDTLQRPAPRPAAPQAARPTAGVYRRRRIAVAVLGALFVLGGARAADAVVGGAAGPAHDNTKVVHYQVQPGDTLWSIAQRHYHGDVRDAIWRIERANHLHGPDVHAGQTLVLP